MKKASAVVMIGLLFFSLYPMLIAEFAVVSGSSIEVQVSATARAAGE